MKFILFAAIIISVSFFVSKSFVSEGTERMVLKKESNIIAGTHIPDKKQASSELQ